MSHMAEFCEKKGKGLGSSSEQPGEAVNHDLGEIWQCYYHDEDAPDYPTKVLQAVVNYNSFHAYSR